MKSKFPPPFPWFGGKSRVSDIVWERFGNVECYVEPFFGSGAILFNRPTAPRYEIINDKDGFVANFWRSVRRDPEAVAEWAIWPCSEVDLLARHRWLCERTRKRAFLSAMESDPEYYDVQIAGWWVCGICYWLGGGGWCTGEWDSSVGKGDLAKLETGVLPLLGRGTGTNRSKRHRGTAPDANVSQLDGVVPKRPVMGRESGITRKMPHVTTAGTGVTRRLPSIQRGLDKGAMKQRSRRARDGVWRARPHLTGDQGISRNGDSSDWWDDNNTVGYLQAIAERLRRVKVCCGEFDRVLSDGVLATFGTHGVFLDPPYQPTNDESVRRDPAIYGCEWSQDLKTRILEWCLGTTKKGIPRQDAYKIALCGYSGEYDLPGWEIVAWKGVRGYATSKNSNRKQERIWFSPACDRPGTLFDGIDF